MPGVISNPIELRNARRTFFTECPFNGFGAYDAIHFKQVYQGPLDLACSALNNEVVVIVAQKWRQISPGPRFSPQLRLDRRFERVGALILLPVAGSLSGSGIRHAVTGVPIPPIRNGRISAADCEVWGKPYQAKFALPPTADIPTGMSAFASFSSA